MKEYLFMKKNRINYFLKNSLFFALDFRVLKNCLTTFLFAIFFFFVFCFFIPKNGFNFVWERKRRKRKRRKRKRRRRKDSKRYGRGWFFLTSILWRFLVCFFFFYFSLFLFSFFLFNLLIY